MTLLALAKDLIRVVAEEVKTRSPNARELRKAVTKEIHIKQYESVEEDLADALSDVFQRHLAEAARNLNQATGQRSSNDTANNLATQICDIKAWTRDIINTALPILARSMGEAAVAQCLMMGVDPRKQGKSTATEWLEDLGITLPPGLAADLPQWMKDAIELSLRESFEQDYWLKIAESTRNDIETFLRVGFQEGESARDLASKIHNAFPEEYSFRRGMLVARTESGHALNSARDLSITQMKQELGEAGTTIHKSWLSILSATTRDSHAALDGVIADADGMWDLDGVLIPWPGHTDLPPENRCSCQCTILTEYGVQPEDMSGKPITDESDEQLEDQEAE